MKLFITVFISPFLSVNAKGNAPKQSLCNYALETAEIHQEYRKVPQDEALLEEDQKKSQLNRSEQIFQKNPRNPAFSESFEKVESNKKKGPRRSNKKDKLFR